jgi:hypothetical protein
MSINKVYIFFLLFGVSFSLNDTEIERNCMNCVLRQRIYFKVLWLNREVIYQCFSVPSFLSNYAVVIDAACKSSDCKSIASRESTAIYNKSTFSCHQPVVKECHHASENEESDIASYIVLIMGILETSVILMIIVKTLLRETSKKQYKTTPEVNREKCNISWNPNTGRAYDETDC